MRIPEKKWVSEPRYGTLLYFAQIVEDMFWHGTRDSYRPPSLDSYHRSVEISKMYAELREAGLADSQIMSPVFTEFLSFVSSDLTIKRHFSAVWEIVAHHLGDTSSHIESKIRAVKLFERVVGEMYLRRCRDEIERYAENEKPKDKKDFRTLAGNYFSYLLNVGHTPEHIYFYTQRHFFERELSDHPRRELQEFFRHFPGRQDAYRIFVGTSEEMISVLEDIDGVNTTPEIPTTVRRRHDDLISSWGKHTAEFLQIRAFDPPGAWAECARSLSLTRALAYTGKPGAELGWNPVMIIASADNEAGSPFSEPVSPLRRRYRGNPGEADKIVSQRRAIISRDKLSDQDRNRLLNAITGYADAFHSESTATQLVSLWSSLEGFLPSPRSDIPRIQSFLIDVCAAQKRMYLQNQFNWLYVDLIKIYRESLSEVLEAVTEYQGGIAKLFAALSFKHHEPVRKRLGELCGDSPLATQRMFELHIAATTCGSLFKLVDRHLEKVGWHILRIYRERNRIVHRANPSKNVSSLIVNLNEYILVSLEAFFLVASEDKRAFSVDDIFSEISIREEARSRNVARISSEPLHTTNAALVAGFALH
jgi:hypothetical protein